MTQEHRHTGRSYRAPTSFGQIVLHLMSLKYLQHLLSPNGVFLYMCFLALQLSSVGCNDDAIAPHPTAERNPWHEVVDTFSSLLFCQCHLAAPVFCSSHAAHLPACMGGGRMK